jgi:hypothetical protein
LREETDNPVQNPALDGTFSSRYQKEFFDFKPGGFLFQFYQRARAEDDSGGVFKGEGGHGLFRLKFGSKFSHEIMKNKTGSRVFPFLPWNFPDFD